MSQENSILKYFSKSPKVSSQRTPKKREAENSPNESPLKKHSQSNQANSVKEQTANGGKKNNGTLDENASTSFPYEVYDIIWCKLEGYPYWPSIVCPHPQTFNIRKHEKNNDFVHVQFFDDPPQRSWIKLSDTIKYSGPQHPIHRIIVSKPLKKSIEYAEEAFRLNKGDRCKLIVELQLSDDDGNQIVEKNDGRKGDYKSPVKGSSEEAGTPKSQGSVSKRKASLRSSQKKRKRVIVASDDDSDSEEKETGGGDCNIGKEYTPQVRLSSSEDEVMEVTRESPADDKNSREKPKSLNKNCETKSPVVSKYYAKESLQDFSKDKSEESWPHLYFEFLKPQNIRDANRRRPGEAGYDSKTLYVPSSFLKQQTPAHKQWWEMKSKHFDTVLFFKVGKFYELFHMDAVIGYKELDLTHMRGEIAHAGFPEAAYERYSDRLLTKGYKVARVEQTEKPEQRDERCKSTKSSKDDKVVTREICRITTPATRICSVMDANPPVQSKYLLAICEKEMSDSEVEYGLCFVDTLAATIWFARFADDKYRSSLKTLFATHPPAQITAENNISNETKRYIQNSNVLVEFQSSENFSTEDAVKYLMEKKLFVTKTGAVELPSTLSEILSVQNDGALSVKPGFESTFKAFGAVINVLKECLIDEDILTLNKFEKYDPPEHSAGDQKKLILDGVSLKNLEVFVNSCDETEGTLMETINYCSTKFGSRLLRHWLHSPLFDLKSINERLDAVEDMMNFKNECVEFNNLCELLRQMPDLHRTLVQFHSQGLLSKSTTHPDSRAVMFEAEKHSKRKIIEFIETIEAFRKAHKIISLFSTFRSKMKSRLLIGSTSFVADGGCFPDMSKTLDFFDAAFDHKDAQEKGQIIPNSGVDEAYDKATQQIERIEAESERYLKVQSTFFGCKVKYFGSGRARFQLEVPEANARKATSMYEYSSSRKGYRRFTTPKTKDFLNELTAAEEAQQNASKDILRKLFAKFVENFREWYSIVECLSFLDCIISLVKCSDSLREKGASVCRPEFVDSKEPFLRIKNGKHPCLLQYCDYFVDNDIELNTKLVLITGPNMGGKSTIMRQTALIVIMAQIGTFVPADECFLTPVDRIFTRLGASDHIMERKSTFYVELSETTIILNNATNRSLVILDELGRGTSTYDGTAIAFSVIKEISQRIKCRTLFSTHYHSLVDDFQGSEYVKFMHMACKVENEDLENPTNETITFLYKLKPGSCPKSYGFNAAKLAGVPKEIIRHGFSVAQNLERKHLVKKLVTENLDASEIRRILKRIQSLKC